MCLELPCGYSSQTLTKAIAYCGITIYAVLTSVIALLALIIEGKEDWKRQQQIQIDADYSATTLQDYEAEENATDVTITTEVPLVDTSTPHYYDLTYFVEMQMSDPVKVCIIIWIVLSSVAGLVTNLILLQGAQERNLFKVRTWFYSTIAFHLLWVPVFAYWVCYAQDPVNVLMAGFMSYMVGGLLLWVVSAFIEELRIESISHRVGYKDPLVPFYKI